MRKRRTAPNLSAVGRALGVSDVAVGKWARSWPFGRRGPFDLDAIRTWRAANVRTAPHRRPAPAPAPGPGVAPGFAPPGDDLADQVRFLGPLQRAQLAKLQRQARLLERQIGRYEEIYAERAAIKAEVGAIIANTRSVLLASARTLADGLKTLALLAPGPGTRDAVEREIRGRLESICTEFARNLTDASDRHIAGPPR